MSENVTNGCQKTSRFRRFRSFFAKVAIVTAAIAGHSLMAQRLFHRIICREPAKSSLTRVAKAATARFADATVVDQAL